MVQIKKRTIVERKQYLKVHKSGLQSVSDQEGTVIINIQAVCPAVLSPEQSVPKGYEGGGVKGTDKYEQQKVETHHDGKMVSEEPRGAAGMSEEENH